jgi:serine/threonine protein kinase
VFCPVCRSEYADDWKVCPKDAASLLRSQFIGKYRLDQLLGVGGMGSVFKAFNPDTQSSVAVKLMHHGAAANDAARQRFQREAASVAALRTRHVVSTYDFGADDDGTLYLVMEYLQGHPLRAEITPMPTSMPLPRVNFVIDQALRGLGAAHRAGIVHRDLKPENLFVADTDDGEVVKILDFGIARVSRGDTPNLTHSGALMGTPAYMAPEQVAGNRGQVGRHSDVYAMGVILYEMLTGISPFNAETLSEVLAKILSRTFAPLPQLRPELPLAVSQLVDRALADDPAQRFGSADAMREAWTAAWSQLPPEIRNATVPQFGNRPTQSVEAAPAPGLATELPQVSTASGNRAREALMATAAATPGQVAQVSQHQSVTPGPVVVQTSPEAPKKSKAGLWVALGSLVAVGGGLAVVFGVLGGKKDAGGAPPDAQQQVAQLDAAMGYVLETVDAAVTPPPADDMVRLAGGTFHMGNDPKKHKKNPNIDPIHEVTVAPFFLDKREVADDGGTLPRRSVSWNDADAYCKSKGKRLPTSAEWDFAARSAPLKLAKKQAEPFAIGTTPSDCTPDGICDLLGNVMEWTSDDWPEDARMKTVRGASYAVSPSAGWYGTIDARLPLAPDAADPEIGFRCAKDGT